MTSSASQLIPPSPNSKEFSQQRNRPLIEAMDDPIQLFKEWLSEANKTEVNDPNAMSLATTDKSGVPDVRIILLKGVSANGLSFFTNTLSNKGVQLQSNSVAALLFHWKSQRRQVRIRGKVDRLPDYESDEYFATRSRQSQIAAVASAQSSTLSSRQEFEDKVVRVQEKYAELEKIPRPSHWGGYVVKPLAIEFWQDQPFRMHDRLLYEFKNNRWETSRLYP